MRDRPAHRQRKCRAKDASRTTLAPLYRLSSGLAPRLARRMAQSLVFPRAIRKLHPTTVSAVVISFGREQIAVRLLQVAPRQCARPDEQRFQIAPHQMISGDVMRETAPRS